jgi:hypothetical protein
MRVIIAGGSGLIGPELAKVLLQNGHEVVILTRNLQKVAYLPEGVQVAGWDGKTIQNWGGLVEGAGAIVNLAGENLAGENFFPTRWTVARKRSILQSRLEPGAALVEAIRVAKVKPQILVQASAIGYYGPSKDEIVDEKREAASDYLASTCLAWEGSTQDAEALGVRRVVIRSGVILSTRGGAFTRLLFPFKFFVGGPFGNGKQYLSWIHIADQVDAIRYLIENPAAQGVYNLTAPQPVTNADFARTIGRVMGRPSFIPVPAFIFRLVFGEVATVVVDGQRVMPSRLLQLGFPFKYVQAEEAVRELLGK